MKTAKNIWVIFDPLDGPHLFSSEKIAWKQFKSWEREAKKGKYGSYDSFWDMSEPTEYIKKE